LKFLWPHDWPLLLLATATATVGALCVFQKHPAPLDVAQAKFEKLERAKSRNYDFDAWRKADDLKCQDTPTLRICQAMPVMARSHAGEEAYVARDFMSFACSATECAWVDP